MQTIEIGVSQVDQQPELIQSKQPARFSQMNQLDEECSIEQWRKPKLQEVQSSPPHKKWNDRIGMDSGIDIPSSSSINRLVNYQMDGLNTHAHKESARNSPESMMSFDERFTGNFGFDPERFSQHNPPESRKPSNIDDERDQNEAVFDPRSDHGSPGETMEEITSVGHEKPDSWDITVDEREEFENQQDQRQKQRYQIQEQIRHENWTAWDLERQLSKWVGRCALCYIRQQQGQNIGMDYKHSIEECPDNSREVVGPEIKALKAIQFERYAGCYECGVAQKICTRWREKQGGAQRFERVQDGICQYEGIVQEVVAAMMIAGPLEVVHEGVYTKMKALGIWGPEGAWNSADEKEVKKRMLQWFGKRVRWGLMEASVLLQVFYDLTIRLERWVQRS
jgi:hypothetical protein